MCAEHYVDCHFVSHRNVTRCILQCHRAGGGGRMLGECGVAGVGWGGVFYSVILCVCVCVCYSMCYYMIV